MALEGLDPEVVTQLANQLKTQSQAIGGVIAHVDGIISHIEGAWQGRTASEFAGWWRQQHKPGLVNAQHAVDGLHQSALNNVAQQEAASGNLGGAAGAAPQGASAFNTSQRSPSQLDQQNRQLLDQDIAALKQQGNLTDLQNKRLQGLEGIRSALDSHGGPQRYLLSFDTQGPIGGHVVISVGDPSTAKNVTTFVPGVTTNIRDLGGGMKIVSSLTDAANRATGQNNNATVFWLGYNAPGLSADITNPGAAEAGASAFATFQESLYQQNPNAHFVVEGHSYGSVLVGHAAEQPGGLHAQDVILLGSPGDPQKSVQGFGVADGHVHVGERGGDPVPWVGDVRGPMGGNPSSLPGVVNFNTGSNWSEVANGAEHGAVAWAEHGAVAGAVAGATGGGLFGAVIGAVDGAVIGAVDGAVIGAGHAGAWGVHNEYWDPGGASLQNQVDIITQSK